MKKQDEERSAGKESRHDVKPNNWQVSVSKLLVPVQKTIVQSALAINNPLFLPIHAILGHQPQVGPSVEGCNKLLNSVKPTGIS